MVSGHFYSCHKLCSLDTKLCVQNTNLLNVFNLAWSFLFKRHACEHVGGVKACVVVVYLTPVEVSVLTLVPLLPYTSKRSVHLLTASVARQQT